MRLYVFLKKVLIFCKRKIYMIKYWRIYIINNNHMSEIQGKNPHETSPSQNFNSLVDYISGDKRINGADKQAIDDLVKLYETEKAGYIQNTKVEVVKLLQESLDKWYTVKNSDDYAVLTKILQLINPSYKLPDYASLEALRDKEYVKNPDVNEKNFPKHFSVTYKSAEHILNFNVPQKYMQHITSNTDLISKISLLTGQMVDKTFTDRLQFDDETKNNNEIDFSGVKVEEDLTSLPSIPWLKEAIDGLGEYKSLDEMSRDVINESAKSGKSSAEPTKAPAVTAKPETSTSKVASEKVSPTRKPEKSAVEPTKAPVAKEGSKTSSAKVNETAKAPEKVKLTPEQEAIHYNQAKHTPEQIKAIQLNLGVKDDGKVGPRTIDAIKAFQALHGLHIDGKVGPLTSKQLDSFKATASDAKNTQLPIIEIPEEKPLPTVIVENGEERIVEVEDKSTTLSKSDENGQEIVKDLLSKWVNINGESSYKKFAEVSWIKLPDWQSLPKEITQPKEWEKLTMALSDGKVGVYFGEIQQNDSGQQYIMKYWEITGEKFEKASFFWKAFAFDDIGNNATLD